MPIKQGEKIVGVAGVDLSLDQLQAIGERVKLYESGYGRLLTAQGNVLVHPDPENIGKPAGEFVTGDAQYVLERIAAGETFTETIYSRVLNREVLKSFAPVIIGESATPWSFSTVVPQEEVLAGVFKLILKMVIVYLIGLAIIGTAIFIAASSKLVIEELKTRSQNAVQTMYQVKEIVGAQTERVNETQGRFELIARSIEDTASIIQKLTEGVEVLNTNKDKLVALMQNLAAIAEENAAGAQEASAVTQEQAASSAEISRASEGLAQIAGDLQELISRFKY